MSAAISFLFYLTILFLPTQLGLHFWPAYTKVLGVRVDYLSPTLYVTDLLILLLFIGWLFRWLSLRANEESAAISFKHRLLRPHACQAGELLSVRSRNDMDYPKVFIFLFSLVIGIIFSKVPQLGLYGFVKILELIFFGYYTAYVFRMTSVNFKRLTVLLSIGVLFESSLAIAQYINQGSLQGLFYFFGERFFNSQTPGIANASLNGALVLRPYGTFSHPNVLAGYLLIALQLIISNFNSHVISSASEKSLVRRFLTSFGMTYETFVMTIILGSIALFLTMSRVAIVLWVLNILFYIFQSFRSKHNTYYIILNTSLVLLIGSIVLSPLSYRFTSMNFTDESVAQRIELMNASFIMIKERPFFGVGLNNFLVNLPDYMSPETRLKTLFLQPVHNIYLFIASETGIVGLGFFVWFIFKTFKQLKVEKGKLKNNFQLSTFNTQLLLILVIGFFDHYFLTLQQGQLLFSFILGLCYNSGNDKKTHF